MPRDYAVPDDTIDITGLDRAAVLAALYNASRPVGLGFLHYTPEPMTVAEAADLLKRTPDFDYLKGRVMKISLPENGTTIFARCYDRDNSAGAARAVIAELRASGRTVTPVIRVIHERGTQEAADDAIRATEQPSTHEVIDGVATYRLTLADQKDILEPAIERALKTKE